MQLIATAALTSNQHVLHAGHALHALCRQRHHLSGQGFLVAQILTCKTCAPSRAVAEAEIGAASLLEPAQTYHIADKHTQVSQQQLALITWPTAGPTQLNQGIPTTRRVRTKPILGFAFQMLTPVLNAQGRA